MLRLTSLALKNRCIMSGTAKRERDAKHVVFWVKMMQEKRLRKPCSLAPPINI